MALKGTTGTSMTIVKMGKRHRHKYGEWQPPASVFNRAYWRKCKKCPAKQFRPEAEFLAAKQQQLSPLKAAPVAQPQPSKWRSKKPSARCWGQLARDVLAEDDELMARALSKDDESDRSETEDQNRSRTAT